MDSSNNDADYHHHHHHLHHYHHNSDYDREPAQHHHQQGQRFPFPQMLAILPIPGAILSIVGSSLIIYIALFNTKINDKNGRTSPYIRLLLGLSVCEIIYSITAALAQYLRPREDASHYYNYYYSSDWSFGTEASCNAIDFFNQFSLSTRLYYGMISFYFLLSVRFGIACIARSLEWTMHGIALGLPLISATIGAIIGLFNVTATPLGCWIGDYPRNCGEGEGHTGEPCRTKLLVGAYHLFPGVVVFILIMVNNLVIWFYVRSHIGMSSSKKPGSGTSNDPTRGSVTPDSSETHVRIDEGCRSDEDTEQVCRLNLFPSQAILYVSTYFFGNVWTGILIMAEIRADKDEHGFSTMNQYIVVAILQATLSPMQGFVNFLVYIRPKYLRYLREFPNQSCLWRLRRCIFDTQTETDRTPPPPTTPQSPDESIEKNTPPNPGSTPMTAPLPKVAISSLSASDNDWDDSDDDDDSLGEEIAIKKEKGGRWDSSAASQTVSDSAPRFHSSLHSSYSSLITATSLEMIIESTASVFEPPSIAADTTASDASSSTSCDDESSTSLGAVRRKQIFNKNAESRWSSGSISCQDEPLPTTQDGPISPVPKVSRAASTTSLDVPVRAPRRPSSPQPPATTERRSNFAGRTETLLSEHEDMHDSSCEFPQTLTNTTSIVNKSLRIHETPA